MLTKTGSGVNGKQAVVDEILKTFSLATLEAQGKGIEKGRQKWLLEIADRKSSQKKSHSNPTFF